MDDFGVLFAVMGVWAVVMLLLVIGIYVVSSYGWMKLYEKAGYERPWYAWVPLLNVYAQGIFLQAEMGDPVWYGYIMSFYWAVAIVPLVGSLAVLAGGIFVLVNSCRLVGKRNGGPGCYVSLFVFNPLFPYLLAKTY